MPDLGLEVLLKGKNMIRILGGLWVALRISLLAVLISIPLGIVLGILMTSRNKIIKVILRHCPCEASATFSVPIILRNSYKAPPKFLGHLRLRELRRQPL